MSKNHVAEPTTTQFFPLLGKPLSKVKTFFGKNEENHGFSEKNGYNPGK